MHDSLALFPVETPEQDNTIVREWLRSKRSPHTQRVYARDIALFYERVGQPLHLVTLTDLQDYADWLLGEHSEVSTRSRMLATVKSLLTFAKDTGYIPFNPGKALQLPQGKDKLAQRILSQAQVQRMLYVAERSRSERDYVLLLLLYSSGIRCAELCGLQWMDVQETSTGGQITVSGKRQKTRSIALHPTAWNTLHSFRPADVSPDAYVFQSRQADHLSSVQVWRIVSTIARKAGIHASPHFMRHSHATHAMEKQTPLKVIQETLGHADLRTPSRYQHVRPETSSSLALDL